MTMTTRIITAIHAAAFSVSLSFLLTSPVWAFVMSWGYLALFVTVALVVMALAAPVACGMDTDRLNRLWILSRYHGAELATLEKDVVRDVNTLHARCDALAERVAALEPHRSEDSYTSNQLSIGTGPARHLPCGEDDAYIEEMERADDD